SFNNIGHYSFDVLQYIFDAEGELLDISTAGSEHINTWVNTPYLYLEAEPGWQGTETITVYALDGWQRIVASDTMLVEVYCEPVAYCGEDVYARDGEGAVLDGSLCIDPLLNGLSYQWSTEAGMQIDNADSVLAIMHLPETEEMGEVVVYLEVNDGYNSSIDSLYLLYWDDEPLEVELDVFPAANLIRIYWEAPLAAACEQIELTGYQMYFEGCEYDTLQNTNDRLYSFTLPEGEYNFGVQAVYSDGESDMVEVSSVDTDENELILVTGLKRIFPNPFNPEVNIEFALIKEDRVLLEIYNIRGQKVKTLVDETFRPDDYNIVWRGNDDKGHKVGSGIYFVKLKVDNELFTNKVVLIK
ncbi:MAG: T9SS type A sorting domain-containing protein, partial [Candidatus Cloacimonetes bacterium]|nr:T9SS type A sorting domain-containing protein [Candidatus Cloacimonadota bacterium]